MTSKKKRHAESSCRSASPRSSLEPRSLQTGRNPITTALELVFVANLYGRLLLTRAKYWGLLTLLGTLLLLQYFLVLASRSHYSVDVWVATYSAVLVWAVDRRFSWGRTELKFARPADGGANGPGPGYEEEELGGTLETALADRGVAPAV